MRTAVRRKRDDKLVRFPRRRHRRLVLRLAVVAGILLAALGALAALWRVGEVRVVGTDRVSALEVHAAAGLRGGESMLLTDMGAVLDRVRAIAMVRSADVRRTLPATVEIRVVERAPLLLLRGTDRLGVDADGVIFPVPPDISLPVMDGWTASPQPEPGARLDARSLALLSEFGTFPPQLRDATASVGIGDEIVLHLAPTGTVVRMGRPSGLEAKAAAAGAVLADALERKLDLEYIDARAPTAPVAK
ncbi:MAG TPA: FtsQ-type POTRA domain-containing protein, partial [Actinomycetota bacterium]|nr:FtsQ-type POTRA domain-containing protein [Actinomycetota bacterium]